MFFIVFVLFLIAGCKFLEYPIYGNTLLSYNIEVFSGGVISGSFVITRVLILIISSAVLTLTTKPTDLNNGLESLLKPLKIFKLNVGVFSMMISIALRYIPTLINETEKILKAQASRGVDFKEGNLKQKISQIISLIVPMFVVAYNRADDLANAMEARGYNPDGERTSINVLKYKASDILALTFTALLFASTIVLRVCYAL